MESFAARGYSATTNRQRADQMIWKKFDEIQKELENLDWKSWLSTAKYRDFFPGIYHSFKWRGWWDFGSGALGDMACHMLTVPFVAAGLKDPTWVRASTSGHDFDIYPDSSIIEFEFPANAERGKIPFWWYDKKGNTPPMDVFAEYLPKEELEKGLPIAGTLIVGEKGAKYSLGDYCEDRRFFAKGGQRINENEGKWKEVKEKTLVVDDKSETKSLGDADTKHMREFFRAIDANDPSIAQSNFVDRAGPLTETILLGNLAVWAAAEGGADGALGDWGEKVEWDAKNLVVTNLSQLKTPGVADLIKPIYSDGYRLD
jgi:hypothetical protein